MPGAGAEDIQERLNVSKPGPKLSVCSIALRAKPVDEAFRIAAQAGYENVEVFASLPGTHAFRDMDSAARGRIRDLAARNGLRICAMAGAVGGGFSADGEPEREAELRRVMTEIDLAADIGAPLARVGPGEGEDFDKVMSRAAPYLRRAAAYAEKKRLRLGIENHSGSITANPDHAAALCREVASPAFGIIYDPGNLFGRKTDYKRGLEVMIGHIAHVHLKDGYPHYFGNDGFAPQRLACTLFGEGELDIAWIIERLTAAGYGGYVSVEYEGWHPEYRLPEAEEGLAIVRRYMARWFPLGRPLA